MTVTYCFICDKNNRDNYNLSFFRFPIDEERSEKWLQAALSITGRPRLPRYKVQYCYKYLRICSEHFEEKMFAGMSRGRLNIDAIPVLFTPNTLRKKFRKNPRRNNEQSQVSKATDSNVSEQNKQCATKKCAVQNCNSSSSSVGPGSKKIYFFKFPLCKHSLILYKWKLACGSEEIMNMNPHDLRRNKRICSLHFEKSAMEAPCLLRKSAVPTINVAPPIKTQEHPDSEDEWVDEEIIQLEDVEVNTDLIRIDRSIGTQTDFEYQYTDIGIQT